MDLAVTRSHDYHRFMASQPNQWEALQDQEAAQPPREYPPDESRQEKAKRPRRFERRPYGRGICGPRYARDLGRAPLVTTGSEVVPWSDVDH